MNVKNEAGQDCVCDTHVSNRFNRWTVTKGGAKRARTEQIQKIESDAILRLAKGFD